MFKKKWLFVVVSLFLIAILAGCSVKGDKNVSSSGGSGTDANNSLTVLDVITKSQQAMKNQNGYTADVKTHIELSGSANVSTDINQTITKTTKPLAFHYLEDTKSAGIGVNVEMYYVDNVIYENINGSWVKISSGQINTVIQQSQQSQKLLQSMKDLIQVAQAGNNSGVSMTQTSSGDYQITLDFESAKANQALKQKLMDIVNKSMKSSQLGQMMQNIQINSYKITMVIDGKTFQYKNMSNDEKLAMQVDGQNRSISEHTDFTFKGSFNGKIEVPANIKATAKG